MRISEFGKQKLKSLFSFLNSQFAIHQWQLPRHFSLSQQRVLFLLTLFILGLLYFRFYDHSLPSPSPGIVREFVVELSGEVAHPAIYIFENPPTLKEAIEKAGGLMGEVPFLSPASSETLETGTLVRITKGSRLIPTAVPSPKGGAEGEEVEDIRITISSMDANKLLVFGLPLDLNRVSVEDLCLIPGIGDSLAREIVTYRETRTGFRSVGEMKNVKGIGEKKYQALKRFFTVSKPYKTDHSGGGPE